VNDEVALGFDMKTTRFLHGEYTIELERNAYGWQIAAITHRPSGSFLPAPDFYYPDRETAEQWARIAADSLPPTHCL
jgi:hypothetical protein